MQSHATQIRAEGVLDGLSDVQRSAACYMEGPLIIVAGPGSGKTRVMSHRMAYILANGVPPYRALGVTFTNKAAGELSARCDALVSRFAPGVERAQVNTFHSWGARFLRRHGELIGLRPEFSIYDRDDQVQLMKRLISDADSDLGVNAVLSKISSAKNDDIDPDRYASLSTDPLDEAVADIYALYQGALKSGNAVDFDDLLMVPYRILQSNAGVRERLQGRYLHLMVDEFQDTNTLRFELVKLLGARHQNVCVVGDPDQSIYSWRNARPENMESFRKAFHGARIFELNESYRSTKKIIAAADAVIGHNKRNFERTLFTNNASGSDIRVVAADDPEHEAGLVLDRFQELSKSDAQADAAVLYRTNAQSRVIETECNKRGIPYRLIGGIRFYDRREVKDALALLKIVVNPTDEVSFRRIVNVPPRGIGAVTVNKLEQYALNQRVTMLQAALSTLDPVSSQSLGIRGRTLSRVSEFARFVQQMVRSAETLEPAELLEFALRASGYLQALDKDPTTQLERKQNLDELMTVAMGYGTANGASSPRQGLSEFLEHAALFSNVDDLDDGERALSLITLHQAKGLEFDTVFIVGVSEGLLPHQMALEDSFARHGDNQGVMEERRLMYVGMTRAKGELQISYPRLSSWGNIARRSRFIDEIDEELIEEDARDSFGGFNDGIGAPFEERAIAPPRNVSNGTSRNGVGRSRRAAGAPGVGASSAARVITVPSEWDFHAGEKVTHPTFGKGVVVNARQTGGDVMLNVAFVKVGVKQLMASMANLERS